MRDETPTLQRRIQELEELHRLAQSLSSVTGVVETLEAIGESCQKLCNAERVAIVLLKVFQDNSVQTIVRTASPSGLPIDHVVNTLAAGWVTHHKKPLVTSDIVETLSLRNASANARAIGPFLSIPLIHNGAIVGTINLGNSRGGPTFSDDSLRAATIVAPLAAQFIERAELHESLSEDNLRLKNTLRQQEGLNLLIGNSPVMKEIREKIVLVAPTPSTVLLTGETGSGKELVAKAIHYMSPRIDKPFVAVNCAAIPESLFESELFGHERGSFTGATEMRKGRFELAHEGTLFLDEISAMPVGLQPKLLRVLEERTFSRLGSSVEIKVDVRLIAASSKNLRDASQRGEFREELYHRLNVVPLHLLPLRDRRDDIPVMAEAFLGSFSGRAKHFSADALESLGQMEWRGNVRELRNAVERISIFVPSPEITQFHLRSLGIGVEQGESAELLRKVLHSGEEGKDLLERIEKDLVQLALQEAQGNVSKASRLLGIDRHSLQRRIEKFGL